MKTILVFEDEVFLRRNEGPLIGFWIWILCKKYLSTIVLKHYGVNNETFREIWLVSGLKSISKLRFLLNYNSKTFLILKCYKFLGALSYDHFLSNCPVEKLYTFWILMSCWLQTRLWFKLFLCLEVNLKNMINRTLEMSLEGQCLTRVPKIKLPGHI